MNMINVICWKWDKYGYRSKFEGWHVDVLCDMVRRNTTVPHKFICITDNPEGITDPSIEIVKLWDNPAPHYGGHMRPNCFFRLKAFDPSMKDVFGEKFIWLDLDAVITGNIDHILNDPADFKMWRVDNERMPCNGSMVMLKHGTRPHIWSKFDPKQVHPTNAFKAISGFVGSDQAWIAQHLTEQDEFFGKKDGVYSFRCHIKPSTDLPPEARIVFFHGSEDPWDRDVQKRYPWIKKYYRKDNS